MIIKLTLLILLVSCGTVQKDRDREHVVAEAWKGHSSQELLEHEYFKTLKLKENDEEMIFIKRGKFPTKARCLSLGGCFGYPQEADCEHVFKIKKSRVSDYEDRGTCQEPLNKISPL